jgi:hypothetical protein
VPYEPIPECDCEGECADCAEFGCSVCIANVLYDAADEDLINRDY